MRDLDGLNLAEDEIAFFAEVYREGLGEFAMRNGLSLDGRLRFENAGAPDSELAGAVDLPDRSAVLIGGGKDSLVSLEVLRASGDDIDLVCVNPREPMIDSAAASGVDASTTRTAGCTISRPKKPCRTSPRARSSRPGAHCFSCAGWKCRKRSSSSPLASAMRTTSCRRGRGSMR
ncbi:MAG: hypothetical protein ACK4MU_09175, partial [Thermomonas sp.]